MEALLLTLATTPVGEVSTTEISNQQFRMFRPEHSSNRYQRGSRTSGLDFDGELQPAVVTWEEASAWCAWASEQTGRTVRLPTEEEWLRFAGELPTSELHLYANGADPKTFEQVVAGDAAYPQDDRFLEDDGFVGTAPVGSLKANEHGLFDLWGNVAEWTSTPREGSEYRIRGGAWNNGPSVMGGTNWCSRDNHYDSLGFRVVVEPLPE